MNDIGLTLRDRLLALRKSALVRLVERNQLDAGLLELAAHTDVVLAALAAAAVEAVAPEPAGRAVVLDDGIQVKIVVYSADQLAACAMLSPVAAIRLAGKLIAAATPKLPPAPG
jgi:hypothetical protein